ncbi:MAG TPA: metal-dependent transcriptional regulator [Bacteroidetes bacterium]|nr:metal-dependent transcriptional regulator [Bacteroidota bacterium]
MSQSTDDLLKAIFLAELEGTSLSASELARHLDISPPGITQMANRLQEDGLVEYYPYRPMILTQKGRELAAGIIRKHRLWEMFMHKALKMGWNEVHREAEMLEHQTSDTLADRLDEYLGYPAFDPHGQPIPDKHGRVQARKDILVLSEAKPGNSYTVVGVTDKSDELMDFFTDIGLTLHCRITITGKISMDQSVIISVKNYRTIISKTVADHIYIQK